MPRSQGTTTIRAAQSGEGGAGGGGEGGGDGGGEGGGAGRSAGGGGRDASEALGRPHLELHRAHSFRCHRSRRHACPVGLGAAGLLALLVLLRRPRLVGRDSQCGPKVWRAKAQQPGSGYVWKSSPRHSDFIFVRGCPFEPPVNEPERIHSVQVFGAPAPCAMAQRELPVRLAVPSHARPGDTLAIMTQVGAFEVPMPSTAKPGKELDVLVPVHDSSHNKLVCAFVQVRRDGMEVPAPLSPRRTSWAESISGLAPLRQNRSPMPAASPPNLSASAMRRVVVQVPSNAKVGDTLAIQTEAGLFQLPLSRPSKVLEAEVPVAEGSKYPAQLTVAWVRVGITDDMAAAAAVTTAAAASSPSLPARNEQVRLATDPVDAFIKADEHDDGEPVDDETPAAPPSQEPAPSAITGVATTVEAPLWGPGAIAQDNVPAAHAVNKQTPPKALPTTELGDAPGQQAEAAVQADAARASSDSNVCQRFGMICAVCLQH